MNVIIMANKQILPELLVSQISVPRLFGEEIASSVCSRLMLPCFLMKRGGILEEAVLFLTCT